jgi:ubiquinone/menaquinone biosynthesis C-methylase UbiE
MKTTPEKYNDQAVHFQVAELPRLLREHLKQGPVALADLGSGDGPLFHELERTGRINQNEPVYAVDLDEKRLGDVARRFPYIKTITASADDVPGIKNDSIDFIISTMAMEHIVDDYKFLREIRRLLKANGKAFVTTVYKKKWAWYFRKRDGESVLDRSHVREYTDLAAVRSLTERAGLLIKELELEPLWFPLVDPLAFRLVQSGMLKANNRFLQAARRIKIPIIGYYSLNMILEQRPID